jgi:hypothetical protein
MATPEAFSKVPSCACAFASAALSLSHVSLSVHVRVPICLCVQLRDMVRNQGSPSGAPSPSRPAPYLSAAEPVSMSEDLSLQRLLLGTAGTTTTAPPARTAFAHVHLRTPMRRH